MPRISPRMTQRLAFAGIWGTGIATMLILLVIIGYVLVQGISHISWSFLSTAPRGGLSGEGGISTVILCTLYLIGLTMAIVVPLGVGAAIYLSEYAPDNRMTRLIRYGTEVLAGVPSIVFGLFGFALFVTALHFNFSILSGALTLACLLLPTLIRTSEEAFRAVPRSHREAASGLGGHEVADGVAGAAAGRAAGHCHRHHPVHRARHGRDGLPFRDHGRHDGHAHFAVLGWTDSVHAPLWIL